MPGYAWIFPVGEDRANIGVGIRLDLYQKRNRSLNELLDSFLDMLGERVDRQSVEEIKSWQLPLGSTPTRRAFDGCMLVGDAGHFIDPLLGAGIYFGMCTGHLAAKVADAALREGDSSQRRLREFDRLWKKDLGWTLRRATLVQKLVVSRPWTMNLVVGLASLNNVLGRWIVTALSGEKL
jgi:flavin-dependent dehydrogenase